jgi:hypothetical protein
MVLNRVSGSTALLIASTRAQSPSVPLRAAMVKNSRDAVKAKNMKKGFLPIQIPE